MLGFGNKKEHTLDPTTLPIFVHVIVNAQAFDLARKIWENNARYILLDSGNHKELLRFLFNDPPCAVWLGRDQGQTDIFELVLLWDKPGNEQDVSEVYVLSTGGTVRGDASRITDLLKTILSTPSIVPVNTTINNVTNPPSQNTPLAA